MTDERVYITNEAEVGLPPLQYSRKAVWDYYRIEFLESGYPGRRTDDVLYGHPIYGPYVIADYVAQYRATKDQDYLDAACRVADAAVAQMTEVGGGLAFIYSPDSTKVSSRTKPFYSGLTQARYVDVFTKLLAQPGTDRFHEPLSKILDSLLVPTEEGGVARFTSSGGLIIEEYPGEVPDCTLNGWTTATVILRDYAKANDDDQAWDLFHRSVKGIEDLIALFDAPDYASSRYKLTGRATFKLTSQDTDVEVTGAAVEMPGSGTYAGSVAGDPVGEAVKDGPRRVAEGRSISVNLLLSRVTWPAPNRLHLSVRAEQAGTLKVEIGDAVYEPLTSVLPVRFHNHIADVEVASGDNELEIEVPRVHPEHVAYPTNFGKKIAGRQVNQYHWIHVDTLGKIVDETGSDILRYFRDRWAKGPSRWPDLPGYQDERIMLERFDPKKHK